MCTEQEDGKLILGRGKYGKYFVATLCCPDADGRYLHFPLITILAAKKWRLDTTSERGDTKLFKLAG